MKTVTSGSLRDLTARAATLPRRRGNLNLHEDLADPIQRMVNAGQPASYVRPHRHADGGRWELFSLLHGAFDVVVFGDDGRLTGRTELRPDGALVLEIPGNCWHSLLFMAEDSALLELKPGPYHPTTDKDFATWAPAEGEAEVPAFLEWMKRAAPGEKWGQQK